MSSPLPVFLSLEGQSVLLVGAGSVALAKLRQLLPTGAAITVVALSVSAELRALAASHPTQVRLQERGVTREDLRGHRLVVSATNDAGLNASLALHARARGLLFNAVDDPPSCDLTFAATFTRGPLRVAIGTDGGFPGLSGALRAFLEEAIPEGDTDLLAQLAALRTRLRRTVADPAVRTSVLRRALATLKADYFHALGALAELS